MGGDGRSTEVDVHAARHAMVAAVGLGLQPLSPVLASVGQALIIGIAVARFVVDPSMRVALTGLLRRPAVWLGSTVVAWSLIALLWSPEPMEGFSRGLLIRAGITALSLVPVMSRPWVPIAGIAIGVGFEAVVQVLMFTGLVPDEHYEPWTITGGLSPHPGNAAVWAGVAGLLLAGGCLSRHPSEGSHRSRPWLTAVLVMTALVGVVLAGNRSLLVGVPVAVVVLVATLLTKASARARRLVLALILIGSAGLVAMSVVAPDLPPVVRVRALWTELTQGVEATDADAIDTSGGLRLLWWRESIPIVRAAPIIGHGSGSTRTAYAERLSALDPETVPERALTDNPHSSIVFELVEHGLIGGILVAAFLVAVIAAAIHRVRLEPRFAGLLAAWVLLLIYGVGNTIQLSMYPLMLFATLTALSLASSSAGGASDDLMSEPSTAT